MRLRRGVRHAGLRRGVQRNKSDRWADPWRPRAVMAGVLCVLMVDAPALAVSSPPRPERLRSGRSAVAQVQGEQRVLHALNRFTFGPRPGEVEEVGRIGLDRWFEQQLHPETIDDSALDARLAAFPAMMLPQEELFARFPSPAMLRAVSRRDLPLPDDPVERAIYAHGIAAYKKAQERKAAGESASASNPDEMAQGTTAGTSTMPNKERSDGARGRVNLLAGDDSGYVMGGKKKAGGTPQMEDQDGDQRSVERGRASAQRARVPRVGDLGDPGVGARGAGAASAGAPTRPARGLSTQPEPGGACDAGSRPYAAAEGSLCRAARGRCAWSVRRCWSRACCAMSTAIASLRP